MSPIRPDMSAGPMPRNRSEENKLEFIAGDSSFGWSESWPSKAEFIPKMENNKSARGRARHRRDMVNSEAEQGVNWESIIEIDRFHQARGLRSKFSRALRKNELNVHDLM